jgi:signal transduction histidine kinase
VRRADVLTGAASVVLALAVALAWGYDSAEDALALVVAGSLALARRHPALAWSIAAAATALASARNHMLGNDSFVELPLLAASAGCAGRWDGRWKGLGAPIALALAAESWSVLQDHEGKGSFAAFCIAAWAAGRAVRAHEQVAASLALRNEELAAEQDAYAQLSVRNERARIAAELHDVVAHAISVMVIQAGAGQRLATSHPELAREAFGSIAGAAREAEADLVRLVALLADDGAASERGLAPIEELVARAAASGLGVRLELEGDVRDLPAPLAALAHRVVQEGVTNALRYASGAAIDVRLADAAGALLVEVANGPATASSSLAGGGTGNGLRGLRERAAAIGGTVHAGPLAGGGWRLLARLPRTAEPVLRPLAPAGPERSGR